MAEDTIYSLVHKAETNHILGNVKVSKYVFQNFYEDVSTIEAYLNSRHVSSDKDSLGRDKPFFNIVLAARNIWFRCTDLDRKNIVAKARKSKDAIASFLFTIHLKQWMRDENFGQYLNDWGMQLASYNSAVTKFVENSEGLHIKVISWDKLIPDIINFNANPKIEILELTQEELRKNPNFDQEMVENLIQAQVNRKTIDRQPKDVNKANYVRLYEVHGELPLSYLTGKDKDKNEYVQQMHIISFVGGKQDGTFDNFTLYSGREKQDPYYLTQLVPAVDGSISLMGAVKSLFDAQWMTNHTIKNIKDQLDLASKLIFQTNDPAYANQNVLENIEQGQIMVYQNAPGINRLEQVANNSHDISALESFMGQWKELTQTITNTPNVMSGMATSNVGAYRKELLMIQQSQANFDIMVQNKGLAIEQMMIKYITPYILKKLNNSKEIVAELGDYGIDKIDRRYISNESASRFNEKAVQAVIDGTQLPELAQEQQDVAGELQDMGGVRYIKPSDINDVMWSDIFEDFEVDIEYQITDENGDQQTILSSLNSLLQTLMTPGGIQAIQTPQGKLIFNEILDQLGIISSVEFDALPQPQAMQGGGIPPPIQGQPGQPAGMPTGIPPQAQAMMQQAIKK
jgi:hypothetical protein